MWIGTRNGLWKTANARSYPVRVSQSSSPVLSLGEDRQHRLWSTYEDGSVLVRAAEGVLPFPHTGFPNKLVYKVMEDADGNFWFSTGLGVARVSGTEVASALTSPATNIDVITMGIAEGARTIECRCAEHPQGWVSPHGNMWIPTAKGFVQANPHRVGSLPSPPVSIESIQSDGRPFGTGNQIRLSAGAHNLEFHFTAVRLGASDQVNFRYRLEGVDDKWIDAGQNRTVRYMQLGPGRYRFLVAARDPMGPWGSAATASIEQEPRFYQTIWFTCAMMVLALFVMTSIYFARLRGIHNRYNAVLQERGRIAREWHDTLLTGLSAIAWQLDAAIHICTHPRLLASLTNVRSMLRYCSDEARLAVNGLRSESLEPPNISKTLQGTLRQLTLGTPVRFELNVDTSLPQLSGELSRDLLRICQEATTNAIRHGKSSKVSVSLNYDEPTAILFIRDNGLGIDPAHVKAPLPGHFGLLGMRERILRIGGELEISSTPGEGTTVKARVPVV